MVPLDAITTVSQISGPEFTMRYNEYRSAQINGAAASGYSSAQAAKALEETFRQTMPAEMGYDYLGMSFQEKKAQEGVPASVVFGMSLLFVFLILAALYESWSLPFSVLLGTPIAVFGAFVLGLLAKPMIVTLPLLLLLWDYWPLQRLASDSEARSMTFFQLVIEKIPLFALSAVATLA